MADIKTHLRELSVAIGISVAVKNQSVDVLNLLNTNNFFNYAQNLISNDISAANNILSIDRITGEYLQILNNGLKLGKYIVEKFTITKIDKLFWCGSDTQKNDPTDLIVNNIRFSLKEHSFILENMGLYKLLSLLTTESFPRGLHVFKSFSNEEYKKWFEYTWQQVCRIKDNWNYNNGRYISQMYIEDNQVVLNYDNDVVRVLYNWSRF